MSNYINVLRRLEQERRVPATGPTPPVVVRTAVPAPDAAVTEPTPVAAPPTVIAVAPPAAAAPRAVAPVPVAPQDAPAAPVPAASAPASGAAVEVPAARAFEPTVPARRTRAFATASHPGIASLLDAIRLISNGRESRIVVFCGASSAESVALLADALANQAERGGMRTLLATLTRTPSGSVIAPVAHGAADIALPVDLDLGTSTEVIGAWAQQLGTGTDLVVITGPPLATSIDAALLACASDGLVIVAESEVTDRTALQTAAERARAAGCKTLGVVMYGSKDRLPGWLRRLVGDRSESHVS